MKTSLHFIILIVISIASSLQGYSCTNILVSKGATTDGSVMISYVADSHTLYGELYYRPAADYPQGTKMAIYDWDSTIYLGNIRQALHTYAVVGNINEH